MRQTVFVLIFILFIIELPAQETPGWQVDFRADIYSRHLWRGYKMGDAPAIEPELSLTKGKFGFTVWGASTFNESYEELDMIVNYQVLPSLTLSLYDYYNPVQGEENNFWHYSGESVRHTIDLTGNFEKEGFPLTFLASVFLFGDKDHENKNEQFSTYFETTYSFKIAGKDFSSFAGFTPFSGYYAGNFAVVNLGISFNESFSAGEKLEIPFELKLCTNPYLTDTWFVVAIGIKSR